MQDEWFKELYRNLSNAVSALYAEGCDSDAIVKWCQDIITIKRESAKSSYEKAIVEATQRYIKEAYPRQADIYPEDELREFAREAVVEVVDKCVNNLTSLLSVNDN